MPNKNYLAGVRWERKVKAQREADGYICLRASGSHGAFDIIAMPPAGTGGNVLAVQCKVVAKDSTAKLLAKDWGNAPSLTNQTEMLEIYVRSTKTQVTAWR